MSRGPMFHFPLAAFAMLLMFVLLIFLFAFIQVGFITAAFAKLGLTPWQGFLLLVCTLFGSSVNIPLFKTGRLVPVCRPNLAGFFRHVRGPMFHCPEGELVDQTIAINFGGCIIPVFLSAYLIGQSTPILPLIIAVCGVSLICYRLAKPIEGVGIGIPLLIPPLVTAIIAVLIAPPEYSPHIAYVAGTMGTLIGADILHLVNPRTMRELQAPLLSIGGAGTFDGIFVTGIIAVLLA